MMPVMKHYYYQKYPYLNYPFLDEEGDAWMMFSIPAYRLARMYESRIGRAPKSFFDCGAATGEILRQAEDMGIQASGIDIKQYQIPVRNAYLFKSGQIQIRSILDCAPVKADLAYCNGTLTYMNTHTLPLALEKFKNVGMLITIHNTTEDVIAARKQGDELLYCCEPRLIKPRDWWMETFDKNGFMVDFDNEHQCFCAIPKQQKTR